ncbi:hypothetical protein BDK51DRAFT_36850 [Blyttiomyces helicus]|uniref:Uncharacterized protein n=1 Tax=Blyttiomyces helicus TaxID=388810 RepID=A0A4P9W5G8_9FUNG|nr:hypothetical protein BDK51DRAFT_36850 [Blyttiomyces helicus]|eukprot:RKO87649.1 hypothetical protein BDK51DRAFT_36850 [Blyttiomyces helicus]
MNRAKTKSNFGTAEGLKEGSSMAVPRFQNMQAASCRAPDERLKASLPSPESQAKTPRPTCIGHRASGQACMHSPGSPGLDLAVFPTHNSPAYRTQRVSNMARAIPYELIDAIVDLLPVRVAVGFRRQFLLKQTASTWTPSRSLPASATSGNRHSRAGSASRTIISSRAGTSERWRDDELDEDVVEEQTKLDIGWMEGKSRPDQVGPLPAVLVAIARQRWDAVRFLIEAGFPTEGAVDTAVASGATIDEIRYLLSLGHSGAVTSSSITRAVDRNDILLVRLLHAHGVSVP